MEKTTISLKSFVADALDEICSAVEEMQSRHSVIAPKEETGRSDIKQASIIEFDIAVEVSDRKTGENQSLDGIEGKVGLNVSIFKSKIAGQMQDQTIDSEENTRKAQNRIKFSVPVYFQYNEHKRRHQDARNESFRNANTTAITSNTWEDY